MPQLFFYTLYRLASPAERPSMPSPHFFAFKTP